MAAAMPRPSSCASTIAPATALANSFSTSPSSASLKTISSFALSTMTPLQLKSFLHPQHGRMRLVLDLDPAFRGAGSIRQVDALADNTLQPELAGVVKDHSAVAL